MGIVLFVAETVPNFGPLLGLIGGSTVSLTSLVFPCLFYIYLEAGTNAHQERLAEKLQEKQEYFIVKRPDSYLPPINNKTTKLNINEYASLKE